MSENESPNLIVLRGKVHRICHGNWAPEKINNDNEIVRFKLRDVGKKWPNNALTRNATPITTLQPCD